MLRGIRRNLTHGFSFFRSIGGPIIVSDYPDTNQKERGGQLIGILHYKFRSLHFGAGGKMMYYAGAIDEPELEWTVIVFLFFKSRI